MRFPFLIIFVKFCERASIFFLKNYGTIQIILINWSSIQWIIIQTRLVTRAVEQAEEKILFANTGGVFRRRSNELRNPSANGMQSNPFAESDLALVNRNRGKSAPNNAAPCDRRRRNCRTNRRFSGRFSSLFLSPSSSRHLGEQIRRQTRNGPIMRFRNRSKFAIAVLCCGFSVSFLESRRFILVTVTNMCRREIHPFSISSVSA